MSEGRGAKVADLKQREAQRRLSKADLLTPRIVEKEVEIVGLGGTVVIRSMSHAVRQELRNLTGWGTDEFDQDRFVCLAVVRSLVDPALTDEDVQALREQDQSIYDELEMQITLLNMIGRTEDLKKDSSPTPNSASA